MAGAEDDDIYLTIKELYTTYDILHSTMREQLLETEILHLRSVIIVVNLMRTGRDEDGTRTSASPVFLVPYSLYERFRLIHRDSMA